MRTQKHDLKDEIKHLESQLRFAVINLDAFTQILINAKPKTLTTFVFGSTIVS